MIGVASAFLLLLQGATAARPGVVDGQLQTREGAPAAAIRISALPAPPPNILPVRRTELLRDDRAGEHDAQRRAGTISSRQSRARALLRRRQRLRISDVLSIGNERRPRHGRSPSARTRPVKASNFTVLMPPGGRVSGRVDTPSAAGVQEKAVLSGVALGELLESPIGADGSFTFGHLPKGSYLLSLFPALPGHAVARVSRRGVRCARGPRPTNTAQRSAGASSCQNGPLPYGWLGFLTRVELRDGAHQCRRDISDAASTRSTQGRTRGNAGRLLAVVRSSRQPGSVARCRRRVEEMSPVS